MADVDVQGVQLLRVIRRETNSPHTIFGQMSFLATEKRTLYRASNDVVGFIARNAVITRIVGTVRALIWWYVSPFTSRTPCIIEICNSLARNHKFPQVYYRSRSMEAFTIGQVHCCRMISGFHINVSSSLHIHIRLCGTF